MEKDIAKMLPLFGTPFDGQSGVWLVCFQGSNESRSRICLIWLMRCYE